MSFALPSVKMGRDGWFPGPVTFVQNRTFWLLARHGQILPFHRLPW